MPLIDLSKLCLCLGSRAVRFDVDALDSCASTNALLLERAAAGAPTGTVLVADQQTAGRGRRGRQWISSPAESLTFSYLWRHGGSPAELSGLSLAIGVAIVRALTALGATGIGLKWPNDILLRQPDGAAKLAGILVELAADGRGMQVVIGVGLNLGEPEGLLLDQPVAGLDQALVPRPDRHVLLAALLVALADVLALFAQEGFAALQAEWLRGHVWQGAPVRLCENERCLVEGICQGADSEGALLIQTSEGMRRFLAGDLSLRPR